MATNEGKYVVGISSDFLADDVKEGEIRLRFPSVDLSPLTNNPRVAIKIVKVIDSAFLTDCTTFLFSASLRMRRPGSLL
jgi:hypothetical protein